MLFLDIGKSTKTELVKMTFGNLSYFQFSPESYTQQYWGTKVGSTAIVQNSRWAEFVLSINPLFRELDMEPVHYVIIGDDFL